MKRRAFEVASGVQWAMNEDALTTLLHVAEHGEGVESIEALQSRLGRPLKNTRSVTTRATEGGNIAIVPIEGPVFRRANLFTEVSGATSTQVLATDFQAALEDSSIKAIILDIDSPGGEVSGTNEMSDMIAAARDKKPVVAYVGNQAGSAAYWMASAASRIVLDETASVGSIGVIMTVCDDAPEEGSGEYRFISSQSPDKRIDPGKSAGSKKLQERADGMADIFIGKVARNRNVTKEVVQSDFGKGGSLIGHEAVKAGMADAVGSLEGVIAELSAQLSDGTVTYGGETARNNRSKGMTDKEKKEAADASEVLEVSASDFKAMQNSIADMKAALEASQKSNEEASASLKQMAIAKAEAEASAKLVTMNADAKSFAEKKVKAGAITPANSKYIHALHVVLQSADEAAGDKKNFLDASGTEFASSAVDALDKALAGTASSDGSWLSDEVVAENMKSASKFMLASGDEDEQALDADALVDSMNAARGHKKS